MLKVNVHSIEFLVRGENSLVQVLAAVKNA